MASICFYHLGTSGRLPMSRVCIVGLTKWLHSLGASASSPNDAKSTLNGLSLQGNSDDSHSLENHENMSPPSIQAPEEPATCCMSGCANCVWLEYAEKLTEYYRDGGETSVKEINEKITDPSIKAYLLFEIRMRSKKLTREFIKNDE
ncbi:oxidoreductase-like domain-containing protein 1 [Dendroctonus ponderosae]|uniref:Oxidoreductase-like domain-containing protein n=2 Tax=Dendroctonus ponderosae TaxID=77166 RepID=A0AAR5PIZ8_DENPD|nr:oxidoreductase-like domain-containing protein 1 [Dendroctonus ponderosae]